MDLALSGVKGLRPNSDPSQTSHCNMIKGLSVSKVIFYVKPFENLLDLALSGVKGLSTLLDSHGNKQTNTI